MPIVTQTQGGQSSAAVNGQSAEYIVQQVLAQMSGCPDSLGNMVFQQVAQDFYYKSTGWREYIGPYTVLQGVNEIDLNPVDQYAQCQLVIDAFLYPAPDGGNTPQFLSPALYQRYGTDTGPPLQYFMQAPDQMILYPVPDKNYGQSLIVLMALTPVLNAGRLPNISITHHFDGLLYGTLHRLGSMQNKPWTVKDQTVLNQWDRRYRQERMIARDQATRAFSRSDAAMRFPNFAGRMSQYPATAAGRRF